MNIDDGDFRIDEIQREKLKICEGKQSGPNSISPVIKRCNFYDIILKLGKNYWLKRDSRTMDGNKPTSNS